MEPERKQRLLVVDDSAISRYTTGRILKSAGFDVIEAASGAEALAAVRSHLPDAVVLDVHLPDIDGFEVCRRLRADTSTAHVPVVHLSSTFMEDADRARGLNSGADGYLTHPVDPAVLVATLRSAMRARQAERAMRESEAKFRAVFENALHGICLLDQKMTYLDVNPALCTILARSKEELIGQSTRDFAYEEMDAALHQMGHWRGVLPHMADDGRLQLLDWSVSMHSAAGVRLAMVTDVTEMRLIDEERERLLTSERAARAEAERANRLKDDFLATLSHELRTPLNAIIGWTHILQTTQHEKDDLPKGLEVIKRNARTQAQLISDLLDVARITSGKLSLDLQAVEPASVVRAALDGLRPVAASKEIELELSLGDDPVEVSADPARLQQVIWNLVHNAIKFTPAGGKVTISLARTDEDVAITVADGGCGILPEFLPHIFDRFRQEDATATRTHGGLGLGLAIVKQLVELHGGSVQASSAGQGQGATFVVRLPTCIEGFAGRRATSRKKPSFAREVPDLSGVRVLVVDDDDDARAFVRRILSDHGAEVLDAADVGSAVDVIHEFSPRVLISDIGMPVQDGYDLIRQVRMHSLAAIALTAYARDDDRKRALDSGFQVHLSKPIDPDALLEAVHSLASPSHT